MWAGTLCPLPGLQNGGKTMGEHKLCVGELLYNVSIKTNQQHFHLLVVVVKFKHGFCYKSMGVAGQQETLKHKLCNPTLVQNSLRTQRV